MKTTNRFTATLKFTRFLLIAAVSASLFATQARQSAAGVTVPIKGYGTSRYVLSFLPPDATCQFGRAEAPGEHQGIISHLGKVVGVSLGKGSPCTAPNFKVEFFRIWAANGDEIHATGNGTEKGPDPENPNRVIIEIDFTIIGGTGRFKNASGAFDWTSSRVLTGGAPPTLFFQDVFKISGTISTVGSNKSNK